MQRKRWASLLVAATLGVGTAIGAQQAVAEIQSQGVNVTVESDLGAKRLVVKRGADAVLNETGYWHQATTQKITVPRGEQGLVVARFSAEAQCYGGMGTYCSVRLLIDGREMFPASGRDLAFAASGDNSWGSYSVERSFGGLPAGEHQVQVEFGPTTGTGLRLDDWSLSLEYWRQG